MSSPKNAIELPAVKVGLENEGLPVNMQSILLDVLDTVLTKMPIWYKIGGPEAKYDAFFALKNGAKGLIAAMVESPYAYKKFIEAVNFVEAVEGKKSGELLRGVNLESKTAVGNIEKIVTAMESSPPDLVVIGRGDLAKSMGKTVDAKEVMESAFRIAEAIKKRFPSTTVALGGGITPNFPEGPWNALSTRFFLLPKEKEAVIEAIKTEIFITEQIASVADGNLKKILEKRIAELNSRLI